MKKFLMPGLLCIFICLSLYFAYNKYIIIGDINEREDLLKSTMWHLYSEESIKENDIKSIEIKYNYFKGGESPYRAYVVFNDNQSQIKIYSWKDKSHKKVEYDGYSSY